MRFLLTFRLCYVTQYFRTSFYNNQYIYLNTTNQWNLNVWTSRLLYHRDCISDSDGPTWHDLMYPSRHHDAVKKTLCQWMLRREALLFLYYFKFARCQWWSKIVHFHTCTTFLRVFRNSTSSTSLSAGNSCRKMENCHSVSFHRVIYERLSKFLGLDSELEKCTLDNRRLAWVRSAHVTCTRGLKKTILLIAVNQSGRSIHDAWWPIKTGLQE